MRYGMNLLDGDGHNAPPVVASSRQHHSVRQAPTHSRPLLPRKKRVVQPDPLNVGCKGLLTAFGLSFTPHIQCKTRTDLLLRPHPIDTFLHLAIAPVTPFYRIRCCWQQLVIQKRQGLFQGGGKELLERRRPPGGTAGAAAAVWPICPARSGSDSADRTTHTPVP